MTNLFTRLKYQLQADFYDFLDKKEAKNPLTLLNQYIREAEEQTKETGKFLARQSLLKKELELQHKETEQMLTKRKEQLELANACNEEELIVFAQDEVLAYTTRLTELEISLATCNSEYFELERKFELMKHKVKDMKVRQLQLMGKENTTRAHYKMDKVLQKENEHTLDELSLYIDGIASKVDRQYETTTFESRLAELEKKRATNTTEVQPTHDIVE